MSPPPAEDDNDDEEPPRALAIASHVTHGYVGNKMAAFAMQALGWDVSAIDTVAFSNHTAYGTFAGRRTPAPEIAALWGGLVAARAADFDVLLSGYAASADAVLEVGRIAAALRARAAEEDRPGGFFWVLDPVMGDNDALYVPASIPPVYRSLLPQADLVLPNAFEAETLTGVRPSSRAGLRAALAALHALGPPHVVITSVDFSALNASAATDDTTTHDAEQESGTQPTLLVAGSTATRAGTPRAFAARVPRLPHFFSGTGDLFAALLAVRLREESSAAGLLHAPRWLPPDDVAGADAPLARAVRAALASVQAVLARTAGRAERAIARAERAAGAGSAAQGHTGSETAEAARLRRARASEVTVVRFVDELRWPERTGVDVALETLDGGGE